MLLRLCIVLAAVHALTIASPVQGQAPPAAAVAVTTDVDYVPTAEYGGRKDRLDVYAPTGAKSAPVVVSIHGGALREGDKKEQAFVG